MMYAPHRILETWSLAAAVSHGRAERSWQRYSNAATVSLTKGCQKRSSLFDDALRLARRASGSQV